MIHHICNMSEQNILFIFASLHIFPQQLTSVFLHWHKLLEKILFSTSTGKKNKVISEFFFK